MGAKGETELVRLTASEAVARLRGGELTPLDLVEASAARIAAVDPHLNALPTRCLEQARERARRLSAQGARERRRRGWLAGLPVAIKDLQAVAGVRTTWGSPIYADHVPEHSDLAVQALEASGAIVVAKSNTPEFGAGASTFNEVFGKTRNPWNVDKSVAGSSGGSAAALASGQVWLASGSDLGGSLRTPASFNGVVGLRPSPGRVAHGPGIQPFDPLSVTGPMARNVPDVALMLDAMSGAHPADPLSLAPPRHSFQRAALQGRPPRRVAFSPDLGIVPVDPEVAEICRAAAGRFTDLGARVDDAAPDFGEAIPCFQTLRAASYAVEHEQRLREHRDQLKPEVIWNIEKGLALTAADIARAEQARTRLYADVCRFFDDHDLLCCPTAIVPPFDVDVRYVDAVGEHRFDNYIEWIAITFAITLTSCPAMSLPVGKTASGLPVGLQLVGPPRGEAALLAAAARLEQTLGLAGEVPIDPRDGDGRPLRLYTADR
jgi:amidase